MQTERIKEAWGDFKLTKTGTHASSIAFFFFMSIIPLLILYAALVPVSGISQQEIITLLCDLVPDALDDLVTTLVNEAYEKSGIGISLSIVTLLWTASKSATALRTGLNVMYDIEENRNRALVFLISVAFILVLFLTLTIVFYLVFGGAVDALMATILPHAPGRNAMMVLLQSFGMLAIGTVVFACCYTYLPAGARSFRMQIPGAIVAAVVWYLFSFGFVIYLDHFNRFAVFYGSIGAVSLFLFWMYWIFYILLVGAFLNRAFSDEIEQHLAKKSS